MTITALSAARANRAESSQPTAKPERRLSAVPEGTEARGFVLYVGLDQAKANADGTSLHEVVEAIRALTAQLAPSAATHAAVALAPSGIGGSDLEVVRLALQDPKALAARQAPDAEPQTARGIVIDLSRKRVSIDGQTAALTFKEFELLQFLVLREGRTVDRAELVAGLWSDANDEEVPNERTIDVHIRRLRAKLGEYEDVVRTVRGAGYRFDRHADVSIRHSSTPSPDIF